MNLKDYLCSSLKSFVAALLLKIVEIKIKHLVEKHQISKKNCQLYGTLVFKGHC